jgi:drug/metabolite transporter (DMT)-like permease
MPQEMVVCSIILCIRLAVLAYGQLTVPAGTASLIVATIPAFTSLWAVAFLGERRGLRELRFVTDGCAWPLPRAFGRPEHLILITVSSAGV